MQRPITRGAAANAGLIFHIFAQDSTSTTGAGKASVAFGSWACRYIRNGEAISGAITPEDITTIGTYAAPTANTNVRIKAVDNTNMIGIYEVQIHLDWVNTTNACQSLTIYLTAGGVAVLPIQIPLRVLDAQTAQLTAAQVATGVWQDATAGDFTAGSSIGKSLYTSGVVPGGTNGLFIAGTNAATAITTALTANIIGNITGTLATVTAVTNTVAANVTQFLGTALTETVPGYIALAFKKVFDVLNATWTALSVNQTGDSFTRLGLAGVGLTNLGDVRIANLDATVSSRTKPADTQAAVTTVTTTTNVTNAPTNGDLTAAMKASVNAEVVDALATDTIAEMAQGIPSATPTHRQAIMYLYMAFRNKFVVDAAANEKKFYNDAGTCIAKKGLADAANVYTESEAVSGP